MTFEKLTCKNCGSNDFHREGDCYVCNHCGTMHVLTSDGTYNINNYNYDADYKFDVPDFSVSPADDLPEKKHDWGCLIPLIIFVLAIGSCMFMGGETGVSDSSYKRDSSITDMALLQKAGHPCLLSTGQSVIDFYEGYGNIVKLDKEYTNETILHVVTYTRDLTNASWLAAASDAASGGASSQNIIHDIEIYFSNMKSKPNVALDEAAKLAGSFMPWELIDKYYQLSEAVSYRDGTTADSYTKYVVIYEIKDKYTSNNYTRQENGIPGSIGFSICVDSADVVKSARIQIAPRIDRHRYNVQNWQAPGLHQVSEDTSWKLASWQLLTQAQSPKLLEDYGAMLEFGKQFAVEAVNISCDKDDSISYGLNKRDQLFAVEGRSREDKSRYVFNINFNFLKLRPEKKVTLSEAVEVVKRFLPYDLVNKYYNLRFARKILPTNKNTDGSISYQVVYDRSVTNANRAEIKKLDLPDNISVKIKTDENCYAEEATINGYRYFPEYKGRSYELFKNEYGEIKEIGSRGRELGPYESGNDFYYIEQWNKPF